jgi:hypothetical protein
MNFQVQFRADQEVPMWKNLLRAAMPDLKGRIVVFASATAAMAFAAVGNANAEEVSITAFNTFHVQNHGSLPHTPNPYLCLFENNGAVQNTCADPVNLDFNLPVSSTGDHTIVIRNFWEQKAGTSFTCTAYTCPISATSTSATEPQCVVGTSATFTEPNTLKSVSVANSGAYPNIQDIALICWYVPDGAGIATMNYTP